MRMRSAFLGVLLAVTAGTVLTVAACSRDATAPGVADEQVATDRKIQELHDRYGWIGKYHTDGLAYVYDRLRASGGNAKNRDQVCRIAAKALKEFHRQARKGEIPLSLVDPALASETCGREEGPGSIGRNVISGTPRVRSSELSPLAVTYMDLISSVVSSATTRTGLLNSLHNIQSSAVTYLSTAEAGAVIAAVSVAISSMDYWEVNLDSWANLPGAIAIPYDRLAGSVLVAPTGGPALAMTTPRWWTHPAVRTYLKIIGADIAGAMRVIYTTWALGPTGWDAAAAAAVWSSITMTLSLLF